MQFRAINVFRAIRLFFVNYGVSEEHAENLAYDFLNSWNVSLENDKNQLIGEEKIRELDRVIWPRRYKIEKLWEILTDY